MNMHDIPREKLVEIIRTYGQVLADEPRRIEALLRDLCPQHPREINLIAGAAREKVPADLLAAAGVQPFGLLAGRLSKRLCDHLSITEKAAQWAVESWALALGTVQLSQLVVSASKAHFESGNTLVDQRQFALAAAEFREAIRLDPQYAEAFNNLGITLAEQGELEVAADAFRQAVRLDPQDAESQSNLGHALLELGLSMEAIGPLQEALRLDPTAPDVQESLERAHNLQAISSGPEVGESGISQPVSLRQAAVPKWPLAPWRRAIWPIGVALFGVFLYYHAHSAPSPSDAPSAVSEAAVPVPTPTASANPPDAPSVADKPETSEHNTDSTTASAAPLDPDTSSAVGAEAALGTPTASVQPSDSLSSGRDTMVAYAPEGSGLSDEPIGADTLQSGALSAEDLQGKSLRALSISHNTIFARHGCTFTRPSVQQYFDAQPWYHPNPAFSVEDLSTLEKQNVETIRASEHARFGYGPPIATGLSSARDPLKETARPGSGLRDHIFSLNTLHNVRLTDSDLEGESLAALSISYNAIYATHGYIFHRDSLRRIFSQMSWYHPNPAFAESDLTETEKANLQTIRAFERKRFGF